MTVTHLSVEVKGRAETGSVSDSLQLFTELEPEGGALVVVVVSGYSSGSSGQPKASFDFT